MIHRVPHQEHSRPRSRTSSGNYNTKQQLHQDDPLPSPSKSSVHHNTKSQSSSWSLKRLTALIGIGLVLLFCSFLLWNLNGLNSHELLKFSIHDSYSSHTSHYGQRGRRSRGGAGNGEGSSDNLVNHFTSKYVEILTRNWLLQQFKYLRRDFLPQPSYTSSSPSSSITSKTKTKRVAKEAGLSLLIQPNTFVNLTSPYNPFDQRLSQGVNLWDLFPPVMNCPDLQRIGKVGEGGKWVCGLSYLQSSFGPDEPCVIYSFGVNDDISFEIELLLKTDCEIFAFDPTIGQLPIHNHLKAGSSDIVRGVQPGEEMSVTELKQRLHFEKIALSDVTKSNEQFLWSETLYDIMQRHRHHFIHLLKVDIESSEWRIFSSLFSKTKEGDISGLPVGEILIELHYEALSTTVDFFSGLYSRHFYSVSREINLIPTLNAQKPFAAEYTFVNVNNFYGVHPPLPLSTSRLNEGENEVTSLRSHSRSNVTVSPVSRTPVKALIYFLTQRKRLPRMCDAVQRLFENFLQHYPHYPVVIFHDDLTAADEDFLQRRCLSTTTHPSSPSASPKREEVSVTLRFVRIDFKTPKHLTKRNVFIPTRTFCDPSHSSLGYRHMCRFHAYGVHRDLAKVAKEVFRSRGKEDDVDDYYIWRLDDDSQLTAPIGYDIFRFMAMNEKLYGFVSMLKDDEKCVMGLWETSRRFFKSLNSSNSNAFNYSDSLLPQWPNPVVIYNNFEISHSSVWRHPVWLKYRDYLDWLGGIYTLRWGDAPIHTIIVTTILDRRQIHKFSDIGYSHLPFLSQKAKGLPMPGMDPFLLLPVTCTYFQEWNCVISAESNTSSNFSFSSTAQRDDFLVSVSLVKKASSRQHQSETTDNRLPLPMPSIPTIPNKERGVIFSFGEIEREDVLVQTIKNFYVQFARQFSIPFVVFYDQLSSFNESKILSALMPLMQQPNDPLHFHLLPVILPNLTSPGADVRIEKNDKCWMNRHDKELSISLFLQRQAFDLLSGMGYQWFFRIPDHARLLMPVTYNPFDRLETAGKKYGFMQTTSFELSVQPCLQSLMSFVDELCADIDDLSRQVSSSYVGSGWEGMGMGEAVIPALPRCSSFYSSDWDKKSLFVTGMAISHVSLWQSLFASFFFDVTHPRQSEDKALTLSEELLSSLSSSANSSKKKKRVTSSASSYQSLLTLLERMKSAHNRTIRSTVMNWGDHVIHNLILLTSTSATEVEKLPHFYVTIGLDERSSAAQALPPGSAEGGAGNVIASRQAQHIRSDVVPLNRLFSPQSFGWLGGDVAVSIPYPNLAETQAQAHAQVLPPTRLLWLFGDTFLGMTSANRRVQEHSQMIDNSVAISTLSELDKDDVACEEREKAPLRHLLHHQYYHRLFNHDEEAEKRGSGIFLLPPQSAKDFCNIESEKASVWPIGGIFAFDSTRRLQLLVLADVSCQRKKDSSTTSSTSSAQRLFGVETLNFHTKQQLLYRVKNPLDTPDLWSYDVVPLNLNAPPSFSRKSDVATDYAWVALAEGKGKYYADADDFIYILASAESRGKGEETRQQHHGFFRVRAKDLLALTQAEDLTSPTSSLEILGRGSGGWQKFRTATDVIEIADLFAPVEHLFPHYRMNEASLFYDVSRNEWVLYHVNSLTLHTSYLYCSLPAKEVEARGAGFRCQYLADMEKKWLHPSVITYAGRLHPHLLHPSLNHLQMAEVVRGKVCDGKRRVMTSQVSNAATSLDLLFRDFDENAATSESRNSKRERDVPTSSEIYVPRFVYIREI